MECFVRQLISQRGEGVRRLQLSQAHGKRTVVESLLNRFQDLGIDRFLARAGQFGIDASRLLLKSIEEIDIPSNGRRRAFQSPGLKLENQPRRRFGAARHLKLPPMADVQHLPGKIDSQRRGARPR